MKFHYNKMGNKLCFKKKVKENISKSNNVVPIRSTTARGPRIVSFPSGGGGANSGGPPVARPISSRKGNNYVVLEDQLVDLDDPSSANLGILEAR